VCEREPVRETGREKEIERENENERKKERGREKGGGERKSTQIFSNIAPLIFCVSCLSLPPPRGHV